MFKNRFKLSPYHVAKLTGVNNAIVKSVYKVAYKTIWDKVPNKNVCFVRKEGDAVTKFLELVLAAASVHTKGRIKNLRVGKNKLFMGVARRRKLQLLQVWSDWSDCMMTTFF